MTDPQQVQPVVVLAQMLGEIAAMHQEQAAVNRRQLERMQEQAEKQTQLLVSLVSRPGAALPPSPPLSLSGVILHKMSAADDPKSFLEMFEAVHPRSQTPQDHPMEAARPTPAPRRRGIGPPQVPPARPSPLPHSNPLSSLSPSQGPAARGAAHDLQGAPQTLGQEGFSDAAGGEGEPAPVTLHGRFSSDPGQTVQSWISLMPTGGNDNGQTGIFPHNFVTPVNL